VFLHIQQISQNVLNKVVCRKADCNCSLGQERSADGGIHATRGHNNVRSVLRNTKKLCRAIQKKMHGLLTSGIVLLHVNVRPYTAACTQVLLEHFNWELFDHPPYSPDVTPSWLGSQHFNNIEE
jgi:hypothetical protein